MNTTYRANLIGFNTLVRKEVTRIFRIWSQTLLPSAITTVLYFIIFGQLIGSRVGLVEGVSYMQFIVPGLVMMSVITSAYANVSTSFFSLKFQNSIEEILVSPMPNWILIFGYIAGGVVRGIMVGLIVTIVALLFTHLQIAHLTLMVFVVIFAAVFFSLAGLLNGMFAKKFDDVMLVPTFILTPLTYLGGVFYSISMLPAIWQKLSLLNPILYLVNAFRYGVLGISDIPVFYAVSVLVVGTIALYCCCWYLLNKGVGVRT